MEPYLIADCVTKHDISNDAEQEVDARRGGEGQMDHLIEP